MISKSFSKHWKSSDLLEVIHSDICGPLRTKTHKGMEYFITFTDDYSRYGHIYLIKYKSEAIEKFKEYKLEVEKQLGRSIKSLNNDRGGEYEAIDSFCKESGIRHLYTMPYKPQQNGIAERRNRTLMDMTRSMMAYAELPNHFWGEALSTAAYILNRIKTKSKPLTPYEYWTGLKPVFHNLKVWGCKAHVLIPKPLRDKLANKTWECRFIGYIENGSGYRFYHSDKGLIESRDAVFLENTNKIIPLDEIRLLQKEDHECQTHQNIDLQNSGSKRKSSNLHNLATNNEKSGSKRQRQPSTILKDYYVLNTDDINLQEDPVNFKEAVNNHDAEKWIKAMNEELESIQKNDVWVLTDLPNQRKAIGCKWVLRKKFKADGSLEKYKARLVAKGFTQQPGVDFVDTYSPVAKFTSVRIIMSIVAKMDLELHQLDVKTAFLNGELKEDIYMIQPEGFQIKGHEEKVYKLKRSLYGLKQSSRQWYLKFHQAILEIGFKVSPLDHCVYICNENDKFTILSLYVDDILLTGNYPDMINNTKLFLSSKFEMKDMGAATYVLGIKITRNRNLKLLYLDQENYLEKILRRFNMDKCKPLNTPISKGQYLSKSMCPQNETEIQEMESIPYAQAVGSLMYAMTSTRPDICHAVGLVSRYQSNPGKTHWKAVKRIFRYLQGTKNMGLCFGLSDLEIVGFTDADFAGDLDDRKSTSGYVFLFGGTAVSWLSKKQNCVAKSTMEAEYISCSSAVSNAVWIKRFIESLNLGLNCKPVNMFCDSKSAISLIKSGAQSSKGKHIDVNYHYIQDIAERGEIKVEFISSLEMVADPMTKGLSLEKFREHVATMGLRNT
jgi:hypothetical protein